jgi:hypothetical protein
MRTPAEVVEEYFATMRAGDPRVAELFHDDARLVGLGAVIEGRPAIDQFYASSISAARPEPALLGPPLVQGDRVAVEISIALAYGGPMHVVDLFEVDGEKIRTLTYFVCEHPAR